HPRSHLFPTRRSSDLPQTLLVRTSVDPGSLLSAIRRQVELLDKDQPVSDVRTMDQVVAQAEAGHRFPALLLGLFAGLALVLAGRSEEHTSELQSRVDL